MAAQPVVLCGKTERIAQVVIAGLKPEYDVIHLVLTPEAGCAQIPLLLRNEEAPSDTSLGSKDYSRAPVAVITGGGYDDEAVDVMMKACNAAEGCRRVPWLRPDLSKPAPPLGPSYGEALVTRVKDTLRHLQVSDEMDIERVTWY